MNKIQEGFIYTDRKGRARGPMVRTPVTGIFSAGNGLLYNEDGLLLDSKLEPIPAGVSAAEIVFKENPCAEVLLPPGKLEITLHFPQPSIKFEPQYAVVSMNRTVAIGLFQHLNTARDCANRFSLEREVIDLKTMLKVKS